MEDKSGKTYRCLEEPILVYESTAQDLPANLKLLSLAFRDIELTQNDHLVMLVYTLMVEAGFMPVHAVKHFQFVNKSMTFHINYLNSAKMMPDCWKKFDGVYSIDFALPFLPDHTLSLIGQTAGNIVVFTACLKDSPSWCIALDSDKYVMRTHTEFMIHRYFNLKDLSQQFKNKIPLPARNFLRVYGSVGVCSILDLPEEMLVMIMTYLPDHGDIASLSKTCVAFWEICRPKLSAFERLKVSFHPSPYRLCSFNQPLKRL